MLTPTAAKAVLPIFLGLGGIHSAAKRSAVSSVGVRVSPANPTIMRMRLDEGADVVCGLTYVRAAITPGMFQTVIIPGACPSRRRPAS